MEISVQCKNLTKAYVKGGPPAVDDVSFEVGKGELFGLIGPDGAGKSSIFRMLTTLILPDKGVATVEGFDVVKDFRAIRNTVGYMPGKFSLYQDLTIEENLHFFATVFNTTIEENYPLIKDIYVQIEPFKKRRAGKLSGGMKQKLALCCALIHKPSVLFLDEPTTGVDPVSRKEFWEMLRKLKAQGITIIVSTPYMDEASLCDRIALIQGGRILSVNTPQNIIAAYPGHLYAIRSENQYRLKQTLENFAPAKGTYPFGESLHVTLEANLPEGERLLREFLDTSPFPAAEVSRIQPGIEDCFITLLTESSTTV